MVIDPARGPADLDRVESVEISEAEMDPGVAGREVAPAAERAAARARPPAVTVTTAPRPRRGSTAVPFEAEGAKWPAAAARLWKYASGPFCATIRIELAVVVEVADRQPAAQTLDLLQGWPDAG